MLNSLMYRLSYYRFDEVMTAYDKPAGYDTVRSYEMGVLIYLHYLCNFSAKTLNFQDLKKHLLVNIGL